MPVFNLHAYKKNRVKMTVPLTALYYVIGLKLPEIVIFVFIFEGEVLFDCNHPEEPPDFIFDADQKGFAPELESIQVSCNHFNNQTKFILLTIIYS